PDPDPLPLPVPDPDSADDPAAPPPTTPSITLPSSAVQDPAISNQSWPAILTKDLGISGEDPANPLYPAKTRQYLSLSRVSRIARPGYSKSVLAGYSDQDPGISGQDPAISGF
nr:hypothetical protein [Tanacetum cinerariifolium]